MKQIYKNIHMRFLWLIMVLLLAACSTDEDAPILEEEEQLTEEQLTEEEIPIGEEGAEEENLFYKLIRIENLPAGGSDENPTEVRQAILFSLEDSVVRSDLYVKTNRWDLAFANLYNSFLSGNNGDDPKNYGYGTNSTGGIYILEQNFDEVIDIPSDDLFYTGRDQIGTDISGDFGQGVGWYLYDFGGNIIGDGSREKQHVAYALQDTRTVVVRTARGNYAKIKMISVYKDAFTPEEWFRDTPHMYFTFEYVLVPAGSAKFEIKE